MARTDGAAPHPLPEGASASDISACTFLNARGRGDDSSLAVAVPSNGGRVPHALYLAFALDMCAVGLVIPLLPTFTRMLGGDARFTGMLQSAYGLSQVIGASFFGGLSDRIGRRPVLQVSTCSALKQSFGGILSAAVSPMCPPILAVCLFLLAQLIVTLFVPETVPTVLAIREFQNSFFPAMRIFDSAARAHALNTALRSGVAPEFANRTAPLCATSGALLPVAAATAIGADVVRGWRQNEIAQHLNTSASTSEGAPSTPSTRATSPAELSQLLSVWKASITQYTSADGLISAGEFKNSLEHLFLNAREARGTLPRGTAKRAAARRVAEDAGLPPPSGAGAELVTSARTIVTVLKEVPALRALCRVRLLSECAVLTVHNTFPTFASESLGMRPKDIGYVMTLAAAMSVFVDIFVLPKLLRAGGLDLRATGCVGLLVAALALPACGAVSHMRALVLALVVVSAGASLVRTSVAALMVRNDRKSPLPSLPPQPPCIQYNII
ncbi:major facilitator superfamily domain-containing protein [Pavlovales sp. CCMP2436]|nr:major facilitator superfamily domain-containing protein [Pavlovales sp. CCMP2436]